MSAISTSSPFALISITGLGLRRIGWDKYLLDVLCLC